MTRRTNFSRRVRGVLHGVAAAARQRRPRRPRGLPEPGGRAPQEVAHSASAGVHAARQTAAGRRWTCRARLAVGPIDADNGGNNLTRGGPTLETAPRERKQSNERYAA